MRTESGLLLPDFLGVGPRRTGSSWMDELLRGEVCLPEGVKETFFFNRFYDKGLDWYATHFRDPGGTRLVGEIAPTYFESAVVRERVARDLPGCKIICTLRDPIERLSSLYWLKQSYGITRLSFEQAVREDPEMFEPGHYARHVEAWYQAAGRENVLVLIYEDLANRPQWFADQLCAFLEIPSLPVSRVRGRPAQRTGIASSYHLGRFVTATGYALRGWRLYPLINLAKRLGFKRLLYRGGRADIDPAEAMEVQLRRELLPEVEAVETLLGRELHEWRGQSPERAALSPTLASHAGAESKPSVARKP